MALSWSFGLLEGCTALSSLSSLFQSLSRYEPSIDKGVERGDDVNPNQNRTQKNDKSTQTDSELTKSNDVKGKASCQSVGKTRGILKKPSTTLDKTYLTKTLPNQDDVMKVNKFVQFADHPTHPQQGGSTTPLKTSSSGVGPTKPTYPALGKSASLGAGKKGDAGNNHLRNDRLQTSSRGFVPAVKNIPTPRPNRVGNGRGQNQNGGNGLVGLTNVWRLYDEQRMLIAKSKRSQHHLQEQRNKSNQQPGGNVVTKGPDGAINKILEARSKKTIGGPKGFF